MPEKSETDVKFYMFVQSKDPFIEKWEGIRTGVAGAKEFYGADEVSQNVPYLYHPSQY